MRRKQHRTQTSWFPVAETHQFAKTCHTVEGYRCGLNQALIAFTVQPRARLKTLDKQQSKRARYFLRTIRGKLKTFSQKGIDTTE